MPHLILASASPRRQAFLRALGLEFDVLVSDIDESTRLYEEPEELVMRLSEGKASAIAELYRHSVVVAADTVVVLDGQILGKPAGPDGAREMLRALRNRCHDVYTAVCVCTAAFDRTRLSCSQVHMRDYSDAEIEAYIATGDPLDKAGAYAIQHPEFSPVERWEGCYAGIMGLPLGLLAELLSNAGVAIPAGVIATCEASSGQCCLRSGRGGC